MARIRLRVSFPNAGVHLIEVLGTDTPRTVAISGPPLKQQVIILHNGHCLNPYLSLISQHVADGDLIVLGGVPSPVSSKKSPSAETVTTLSRGDGFVSEIFRLADQILIPYEMSASGALAYRQICLGQSKGEAERIMPQCQTLLAAAPQSIPCEKLPVPWEHADTTPV
jgi:hypothetical protein